MSNLIVGHANDAGLAVIAERRDARPDEGRSAYGTSGEAILAHFRGWRAS